MTRSALPKFISQSLRKNEAQLLQKANVVGVGIGEKIKNGLPLGRLSLKVYVEKKYPKGQLAKKDIIPQSLSPVETDVEEAGRIVALGFTGRYRPALGGVWHYKITAGTFCCLVKDRINNKIFILSNNHVMANSNKADKGDIILQPGPYDGGRSPRDIIGYLDRWVEIKFGNKGNLIDAALAIPKNNRLVRREIIEIGAYKNIIRPRLGMLVQKSGRTTGYTAGKIKDITATVKVYYNKKIALFRNQILTTNISQGGDSGSAVLDMQKRVVGLLFAGSEAVTIVNPFYEVEKQLNVELY